MANHSSAVAHQFDDAEQQFEASSLGMWVFLLTEVMFFGGLFIGYIVYRTAYPEAWAEGSNTLDVMLGGMNTAVLICSSLTMALAVHAAQTGNRKLIILFLVLTIVFGAVFLGVKAVEYSHKFHEHHVPGPSFQFEGEHSQAAQLFFSFYFAMTGVHAVHMIIGIGYLLLLIYQAWKGLFTADYFTPVEMFGLYWHFVDIIWIFLYPLLYLVGRH
ncbi:MAG: cytochrome c oxidase subunit 3 family protein [Bryobacterales bacterium]